MRPFCVSTRLALASGASILALLASPALAQQQAPGGTTAAAAPAPTGLEEIVVTAQRQAESLQDVPIAVSAFSGEALERQQINNTTQLQLSLPNISFTKTNFTSSSFSIRGIGNTAVGISADAGVGIHVNDMPIVNPRLFETEFFDLERVEVLRGPQGTLFGRNATGGVVNFITARPVMRELQVRGEAEYGNYNAYRFQGMINVPIGETLAARIAGQYIKRDGYTLNTLTGNRIDGRDQYAIRGSLRWEPTDRTTVDLIGYYFDENSNRSRIQKQLCNRDPTGVLGCSPNGLGSSYTNGNATLASIVTSSQFLAAAFAPNFIPGTVASLVGTPAAPGQVTQALIGAGLPPAAAFAQAPGIALTQARSLLQGLALGDLYGPDAYSGLPFPTDLRTVRTAFEPRYRSGEIIAQLKLQHDFGPAVLSVTAGFQQGRVKSETDYNLAAANPTTPNPVLSLLFPQAAARLYQNNLLCVSEPNTLYSGVYGGFTRGCFNRQSQFDQSGSRDREYSVEAHLDSKLDGPFNFLIGGIYVQNTTTDANYFVVSNALDYAAGLLGGGAGYAASPFFNSETNFYRLKSYAGFGEAYFQATDTLKITAGLRYTTDEKFVRDRGYLFDTLGSANNGVAPIAPVPFGTVDAGAYIRARIDADFARPGVQPYREASTKSSRLTGRFVIDWKPETSFSDDTLVYASYSRGYKPGGINPPFNPALFTAPAFFAPESIDAFEVGTKNRFRGGTFQANLSAFYYRYKDLQVSRIINRTSFNDNTDADVYGVEGEFLVAPVESLLFNINASYLKTKIKDLSLIDTRDPSGGRSDTVIIKDITDASNCVVQPAVALPAGSAAAFVNGFNAGLNAQLAQATGNATTLRPVTPIPGTNTVGGFGICSALAGAIASAPAPLAAAFGQAAGSRLPFVLDAGRSVPALPAGVPVSLNGNELQNSPRVKVSVGGQYTARFANEWNAVLRADLNYTGEQWGRNFNSPLTDRIQGFTVINTSIQLNAPDDRFFVRGFVQNLTNNQAVTGLYVTDPSSGLFTNIFTLEPRRYGVVAGFRF